MAAGGQLEKEKSTLAVAAAEYDKDDEEKNQEDEDGPLSVELLEGNGITERDIKNLQAAGLSTVNSVSFCNSSKLQAIRGITKEKADKLMAGCRRLLPMGFTSAAVILRKRAEIIYISTGSKALDGLLGGGIETGCLTEIYGEAKSGKTQLCHQLAVMCQLPVDLGGGEGKAMYITTEDCFRPKRVIDIATHHKLDASQVTDNIAFYYAKNTDMQNHALILGAAMMSESRYALVIIDSATSLYRTEYQGRGELSERQQKLAKYLRHLSELAQQYGAAILITNQVVADLGGAAMFNPNPIKPIGGDIVGHASKTRLYLRKMRGEKRICSLVNSPNLPPGDAAFNITANGVEDVDD